ncbi:MAG: preprotein translocase subunit SecY, partial [Spirochaetia bacterium]|nr:preprotein translocase subunit SecY [Spirochaetia bacterium]
MSNFFTNILRVPGLRQRILFTIGCLVVYRLGCHITTPGINPVGLAELVQTLTSQSFGGVLNFLDLFAGGALTNFTIFAL